jgi:hypothetical protein
VQPLGCGYTRDRTDTTQQSGQTPDKEVGIKNITVYVSGYTETPEPTQHNSLDRLHIRKKESKQLLFISAGTLKRQNRHNTTVWTDSI